MTLVLGVSAYYHDSGAALIKDGQILAAAQEERFTRKKHDPSFPVNAARYCLNWGGCHLRDLDAIVFYDKPLLKMERLLETYYAFAPTGLRSFLSAMPTWIKEKLFLKKMIQNELKSIGEIDLKKVPVLFPEHHLSHAASAFYPSPFEEAAILTIDGVGEWATASIGIGRGKSIKLLKELRFPHSVGLLYSAFTYYLGFRVNSGEYKLMGLAPYGNPNSEQTSYFKNQILQHLIQLKDDGSIWLNQAYFDYSAGLKMAKDSKWENLFGIPRREPETEFDQYHCNLALAIQQVTEEIVLRMAREARKITGCKNLTMAGGVALNCVANGKLSRSEIFENLWIQPAAGDAGGALGAAYAVYHNYFDRERTLDKSSMDFMAGSFLGPEATQQDIEKMARKYNASFQHFNNFDDLADEVSKLICDGKVIGWHQGRMEWGPRALGNRSILGDARNPEMQKKLNLKIKYRESFRPFAPSIMAEDAAHTFNLNSESPYMLLVTNLLDEHCKALPENYFDLPLKDRLNVQRSHLPAITHIDFSARVQTIHKETNPRYHMLLQSIKEKSGTGIVINTSFNVRGEPPVCTPEDSYVCFMRTEMDYLVINDCLFKKETQPNWPEKGDWRNEFTLD